MSGALPSFAALHQSIYVPLIRYTSSPKSANNRFIHLTNYSVSKRNKKLDRDDAERDGFLLGDPRFSKTASKWYGGLTVLDLC